ncbi:MAG: hypothetical protein JST40_12005 [Armatimonadetes bacterium]|nr:hypothetical protein [Armatimonadota bacterium]
MKKSPIPISRSFLVILLSGVLMLLGGCGGGGGDVSSASGSVLYSTNWGSRQVAPVSQILTLLTAGGDRALPDAILNRSAGTTISLSGVSGGSYLLSVQLKDAADGGGNVIGTTTIPVSINGDVSVATSVDGPVSQVRIDPSSATVPSGTTKSFTATAYTGAGAAVFLPSGNLTWSVGGGIGSVTSSGLFTATSVGTGTVVARDSGSSISGSASVVVAQPDATISEWTVLVYLNAANDLYSYSDLNVNQMEQVASNSNLRFVVQWKQSKALYSKSSFDGTRRYLMQYDVTNGITSPVVQDMGTSVDMGLASTLKDFITWGMDHYPARRYALIVWNHGSGWTRDASLTRAASYDDQTGNSIQTWQMDEALAGRKFDIFAWDCSLMQMLEVAYEIRDHATYIVGSEESPPGEGYPYDLVFAGFRDNPSAPTETLVKGFVDGPLAVDAYKTRKITQSVLKSSALPAIATALDNAAAVFLSKEATVRPIFATARTNAQSYSPSTFRYYRDLQDLMGLVRDGSNDSEVKSASQAVIDAADNALVWEGHNSNSARSTGLSIESSPGSRFGLQATDYNRTKLGKDTRWDDWLKITD